MSQSVICFRTVKYSTQQSSPIYKCEEKRYCRWHRCKETFETDTDLVRHIETRHFSQTLAGKNVACRWDGCRINGQTFTKVTHLHRHVLQYHGGPKPYICAQSGCGKAFSKESALVQHAAAHKRMTSPPPAKPAQKAVETPQKRHAILHYRRVTPPVMKQVDPIDAPVVLAIEQWLNEGRCQSRKLSSQKNKFQMPAVVIGHRLTKSGQQTLLAPMNRTTDVFQQKWIPASVSSAHLSTMAPTTMVSLLSAVRASANTEP